MDSTNITIGEYYIESDIPEQFDTVLIPVNGTTAKFEPKTNGWFRTYSVEVGDKYILDSAFINLEIDNSNSYVVMRVRNEEDDEIIQEKIFRQTGNMDLVNIFNKTVYISMELVGDGIRVYSFGLGRTEEIIMNDTDIHISPDMCFYGEDILTIDYTLNVPSWMDIIIFDANGGIIDYILEDWYLTEGDYLLAWNPLKSSAGYELPSGTYFVYFNAESVNDKNYQTTKSFLFVNR